MAAKIHQNSELKCLEIKLNELFVAKRRLRYMYLRDNNVISTVHVENSKCMPLFLACDVLCECGISQGNLPRFHAKLATRGLATKVNFPPCAKILGIHGTGRGVWFYSIQGVFRVAFELYNRNEQDGCLRQLVTAWRSGLLDPVLENEVHVAVEGQKEPESERGLQRSSKPCCNTQNLASVEVCGIGVGRGIEGVQRDIGEHIDLLMEAGHSSPYIQQELQLLKTYISFLNLDCSKTDHFLNRTVNMLKNCLNFWSTSSGSDAAAKEKILSEVAAWLGTEFAGYHTHVSEQVTIFKQNHIRTIDNLPCAEILVNEVFPASMQTLLRNWLDVRDEPTSTDRQNNEIVEESSSEATRRRMFPIIQIILELANKNLVSGVAHILYSRLILSESV